MERCYGEAPGRGFRISSRSAHGRPRSAALRRRRAAPGYTVGEEAPSRENSSGIEDILVWWELAPSAVLSLLLFAENRAVADHRATRWRW